MTAVLPEKEIKWFGQYAFGFRPNGNILKIFREISPNTIEK